MNVRLRVSARLPGVNRSSRHCLLFALTFLSSVSWHLLGATTVAAAECPYPTRDEGEENAREHYALGEAAFKAGHYETALCEFEVGFASSLRPGFLLNMAHTVRRLGDLREARALYKKYLLVDPSSNVREEVMTVIGALDSALADEDLAGARQGTLTRRPPAEAPGAVPSAPAPAPVALRLVASQPTSPVSSGSTPVYHRAWFWLTVGLVVVSGTAVAIYALRRPGGDAFHASGSLGAFGP